MVFCLFDECQKEVSTAQATNQNSTSIPDLAEM